MRGWSIGIQVPRQNRRQPYHLVMMLRFDLSPEAEARLRDRALQSGLSPEEYARRLVEEQMQNGNGSSHHAHAPGQAPQSEKERRLKAWRDWFSSHKPIPHPADDSRESIYSDRDE